MLRRDSFTVLRDTLRWRVALVLVVLILGLMFVLALTNTRLGLADTALLAWIVLSISAANLLGLLTLPRHLGGSIFFATIALLLIATMGFGWYVGRPMQHWAYIFPPALIFLVRSGPALAGMLLFGVYAVVTIVPLVAGIEVIRFASGYGLLVCFMYTYALLQERAADMLRYHSDHDALSNCLNRRTFNETLSQLAAHGAHRGCTFLLIDIDHFKAINDSHGHLVGDRIITEVAAALGRGLDAGTPLFRYGGEEFAVLLVDAPVGAGATLAERLRGAIASSDFRGVPVTVSIGVAEWRHEGRDGIASALDRADRALYAAKRAGRNCVISEGARSPEPALVS